MIDMKEKIERDWPRKLRRAAESSLTRIVAARDLLVSGIDQPGINLPRPRGRLPGRRAGQRRHDLTATLADFGVIVLPRISDPAQHLEKARLPVAIIRREISAANK